MRKIKKAIIINENISLLIWVIFLLLAATAIYILLKILT